MLHRGRIARDREIKAVRELVREDLEVLKPPRPPPIVARFRDSHHWVAKLLVAGLSVTEVAAQTGYSMQRIMQLKQVPAFQQLMSDYRNLGVEVYKNFMMDYLTMKMSNRIKAERQIAEKLDAADEEGELLPVRELISISREQDRNTNIQVNVGDFAQQLDGAISRSSKVINSSGRSQISPKPMPTTTGAGQTQRRRLA